VSGASLGCGLESGLVVVGGSTIDLCACALTSGNQTWVGLSSGWALPPRVAAHISSGGAYNEAFDAVGVDPDDRGDGVLAKLSGGKLSRPSQMQEAVSAAMLQMYNERLYSGVDPATESRAPWVDWFSRTFTDTLGLVFAALATLMLLTYVHRSVLSPRLSSCCSEAAAPYESRRRQTGRQPGSRRHRLRRIPRGWASRGTRLLRRLGAMRECHSTHCADGARAAERARTPRRLCWRARVRVRPRRRRRAA
jgi:hypothetical protein